MHFSFEELKKIDLSGSLSSEIFLKLSIYSKGYTPFSLTNSNNSPLNYLGKYLKSSLNKFLTNEYKFGFINCLRLIKIRFLLFIKSMHFSNPFGMKLALHQIYPFLLLSNDCHDPSNYEILEKFFYSISN